MFCLNCGKEVYGGTGGRWMKRFLICLLLTFSICIAYSQETQRLTYYVNGKSKTVDAVYVGLQQSCYYLDDGGNIVWSSRFVESGKDTWSDWSYEGLLVNRIQPINSTEAVYGFLSVQFDFYSAVEQKSNGTNLILIYIKNDDEEFIWCDDDYVYILQKVYVSGSKKNLLGTIGDFLLDLRKRVIVTPNSQSSAATPRPAPQASASSSRQNSFQATHRVITNDGTNLRLRDSPGFNGRQIGLLDYGSYVKVLETGAQAVDGDGYRGNWVRVSTPDGRTGWCFGAYLRVEP